MTSKKLKNKNIKSELGQTLVEVLVALSASVAVVTAITITVITSLSNAEYAKNQNLATQYAGEGLEITRQIAKNDWTNFQTYTSTYYCLPKDSTTICPMGSINCGTPVTCGQNIDNLLSRQIVIVQSQSYSYCGSNPCYCTNSAEVISSVSWGDSRCQVGNPLCHKITLRSCLANINSVQGP